MPLWGADGNRAHDALSREISQRNAARTIRGGDFSTPLRFGRNDERGARQHRHLERSCMPLWGADGNRAHDALSREISQRNAARTIRGGDFSTPLRFGRNDERGARQHRHLERGDAPVWVLEGNRFDETLSREISQRNAARTIRGEEIFPLRNAFVEMTKGATITLGPKDRCPLSESDATLLHNLRRQPRPFFIICARRALPQPSACKAVKLKNPPANGRSILRTFLPAPKRPYTIDNALFLPYNNIVMEGCPSG